MVTDSDQALRGIVKARNSPRLQKAVAMAIGSTKCWTVPVKAIDWEEVLKASGKVDS